MKENQTSGIPCSYQNTIEVKNLSKKFPDFSLNEISFTVPAGSIMGFIGENGSGKTTTIKLILNQLKKDSGSIHLFDVDHQAFETDAKQDIGVVLDQGFFYECLNALQISKIMAGIFTRWNHSSFMSYLDRLQVPSKKEFKELSKGTKMKLCIACALAHSPKLLILDEATSGLDPVVRKDILDLFQEFIQNEQNSILMSSHITEDLEKVADYITFIQNGSIVLSETKDDLLNQYGIIRCGKERFTSLSKEDYVSFHETAFGISALTKNRTLSIKKNPDIVIEPASLEEIMIFYHQRKE